MRGGLVYWDYFLKDIAFNWYTLVVQKLEEKFVYEIIIIMACASNGSRNVSVSRRSVI